MTTLYVLEQTLALVGGVMMARVGHWLRQDGEGDRE